MSDNLSILLDPRAEEDIDTASQWYAKENTELALEFLDAIDAAVEFITQFPQAYPEVAPGIRRVLTKKFPFCIYYKVGNNRLTIVALLHIRRKPDIWRERIE